MKSATISVPNQHKSVSLQVGEIEVIRFEESGDCYVKGELIENNREVYERFVELMFGIAPKKKEAKCVNCGRMNDVGVDVCWMCGCRQ